MVTRRAKFIVQFWLALMAQKLAKTPIYFETSNAYFNRHFLFLPHALYLARIQRSYHLVRHFTLD